MGVNVAAHTRHIFLGSAPPPDKISPYLLSLDLIRRAKIIGPMPHSIIKGLQLDAFSP